MFGRSLGEGAFARVVHCRKRDNLRDELEARLNGGFERTGHLEDSSAIIEEVYQRSGGISNVEAVIREVCRSRSITYNAADWTGRTESGAPGFDRVSYAVKIMDKAFIQKLQKVDTVMAERRILSKLRSPWVIELKNSWTDANYLYMVMELAPGGELLSMINNDRRQKESEGVANAACSLEVSRFYLAELTIALEFIHRKKVYHRDLKPENILIMSSGHMKLTDFGTAMEADGDGDPTDFVGTAFYVSPEVLAGEASSRASDLWGLGCIIYQMLTGKVPFRAPSEYLIFQVIQAHNNYAKLLTRTKIEPKVFEEDQQDAENGIDGEVVSLGMAQHAPPVANETLWMPLSRFADAIAAEETTAVDCEYYYQQDGPPDEDLEPLGPVAAQSIMELASRGELGSKGMATLVCPTWCGEPVWKLEYPSSVTPEAQDLIAALLVEEPAKRLGASAMPALARAQAAKAAAKSLETEERLTAVAAAEAEATEAVELGFAALRSHHFFDGLCTADILESSPPYIPAADVEFSFANDTMSTNHEDISDEEAMPFSFGEEEMPSSSGADGSGGGDGSSIDSPWAFALNDGETIAFEGVVTKRSGLSRRTRQLVLTTGPRLLYFDPVSMLQKGEIQWTKDEPVETFKKDDMSFDVRCTSGNFAGRDYNLTSKDPGGSDMWIKAIGAQLQIQRERG